jgi:hypothetical protein
MKTVEHPENVAIIVTEAPNISKQIIMNLISSLYFFILSSYFIMYNLSSHAFAVLNSQ